MRSLMMIMMTEAPTKDESTPMIKLCPANFLKMCHSVLNAL